MNIFLTGGTGFLGHELLKALKSRNHRVTALVRSAQKAANLPVEVAPVEGSVEQPETFRKALQNQDVFVHTAALVKMWVKDKNDFQRVNVDALKTAIQASSDAGIRKFIHTSSFIALGPSNGKPIREEDSRRSDHFHNEYERTKYEGDRVARNFQERGYPVSIVYPGVIYGPGNLTDGNIVAKNIIPFLNGRMPFGLELQIWSYAFVQDVVQAFVRLIETETPSNRYILGGENHSGADFYQVLYEVTGKKPPSLNIPLSIATVAGYSEYLLAVLFGKEPSMLTHEVARIYKHSWAYDSTRAQKELNYQITPLKEGLRQMVSWFREAGLIKK